jgi:methylase of polypeptide subunit release factors
MAKGFAADYAATFTEVEQAVRRDCGLRADDARRFTQLLFIRLMFVRLLEPKRWLSFRGRHDYLRGLYDDASRGRQSIYKGRLRPLFFGLLRKRLHVPTLVGGLFEPSSLDRLVSDCPDEALAPILRPGGLLDDPVVTPDLLGRVLEERLPNHHRHGTGSYYTSRPIVSFMCREALKGYLAGRTTVPHRPIEILVDRHRLDCLAPAHAGQLVTALGALRAIDPACGCGAFLIGLLDELLSLHRLLDPSGLSLSKLKRHILTHNLHGIDLDPIAAHITILRLWLSFASGVPNPPRLGFNIRAADALVDDRPAGCFDIVLTNPPYLSTKHGFARGRLGALRSRYTIARGHFDAYALFLERGLQLLRPGGHYAYIVPKPILTNANMRPIRELLARHALRTIADPGAVFPAAAVEPIIIVGQNSPAQPHAKLQIVPRGAFIKRAIPLAKPIAAVVTPAGTWNLATRPLAGDHAYFPRLGDFFTVTRGVESGKRDSAIHNHNGDAGSHPLLRGEDLTAYRTHFASFYIRRNGDAAKFKPAHLYAPPSLLVRRVANDLIAAVDRTGYHVLNTIYVLKPRPACPISLEYACAVLNSSWANAHFHRVFVNDDKLFPYIRKHQLIEVAVPPPDRKRHAQITEMVRYELPRSDPRAAAKIRRHIDALVRECVPAKARNPASASASPAHAPSARR